MISLISNGASMAIESTKYVLPSSYLGMAALVFIVGYAALQNEEREYDPFPVTPRVHYLKQGTLQNGFFLDH